jgi:hypothetical protein
MTPSLSRLMPVALLVALVAPTRAVADDGAPAAGGPGVPRSTDAARGPTPDGADATLDVASRSRRPAARPTRRPAARQAYRPAVPRGGVYRPGYGRSVYRPSRSRVVYVPTRPIYRPVAMGPAGVVAVGPANAYFSLGAQVTSVEGADRGRMTDGFAPGGGFNLAYGFYVLDALSVETAFGMTFHELADAPGSSGVLGHVTTDLRIHVGAEDRALQPYLLAGLGFHFAGRSDTSDPALSGLGFQAGGGVDYFLSPSLSIGAKGTYRGAYLDDSGSTLDGIATESMWLSNLSLTGDLKVHF